MSEPKHESTRNLLAQIEGDWEAPKSGPSKAAPDAPTAEELHAELDAAADRLVDSLGPPASTRNVEELDSGWGDEEGDDEDEDDEANEPALPDEQLDPVAYAEAKEARDERVGAKREKRRLKAEAKKVRRRARADAQKGKQKGKQRKARAPQAARALQKAPRSTPPPRNESGEDDVAPRQHAAPGPRSRAKMQPSSPVSKPMLSKTNQWMLAFAVLVFIAAAVFAAVVAR